MNTFSDITIVQTTDAMSAAGECAANAYARWLASRPDLWCAGDETRREVYATLAGLRQRAE